LIGNLIVHGPAGPQDILRLLGVEGVGRAQESALCRRLLYCVIEVALPKHHNLPFAFSKRFGAVEVYHRDGVR
jgi:hypothetical protein